MKVNWQLTTLSVLVIMVMSAMIPTAHADVIYGERSEDIDYPVIQVVKWASGTDVELGEEISIFVNITNWSDQEDAFNLTVTEPLFSDWAYTSFVNWENYTYIQVDALASFTYNYSMIIKSEGKYTIDATEVSFFDENSTEYSSRSQNIPISVDLDEPPLSQDELWDNVLLMSIIILAVPVALFFVNNIVWRKD